MNDLNSWGVKSCIHNDNAEMKCLFEITEDIEFSDNCVDTQN